MASGDDAPIVDGRFLFTLYDTYGFPMDLAQEVLQEAGWSVPQASLEAYVSISHVPFYLRTRHQGRHRVYNHDVHCRRAH